MTNVDEILKTNEVAVIFELCDNNKVNFKVINSPNPPDDPGTLASMTQLYLAATGIVAGLSMPGEFTKAVERGQGVLQAAHDLQEYGDADSDTGD